MNISNREKTYEICFKLILHAGNAKSEAADSINASNEGDFEKAKALIKEALIEMKETHKIQTELIQAEADGNDVEINVLLIHAQDHFSMALMSIEIAQQMLCLNERIVALEKKEKEKI